MPRRMRPPAFVLAALLLAPRVPAQDPGPLPVGFTSHWSLDPARSWDMEFPDGSRWAEGTSAPRPILVQVWYPAAPAPDAPPLRRGELLDLPGGDARTTRLAQALRAYAAGVVAEELLGEPAVEQDEADRAALDAVLSEPTRSVRDAPPSGGRWPLVIYHAGYGSSFEDNAACAERLASHGYVVAGSAFQDGAGEDFNIDALEGSLRDLEFLVRELSERPDVDASRLALAGHSGGAHLALRAQAQPQAAWDALLVLDATQDYWPAREPRWSHPAAVLAAPER